MLRRTGFKQPERAERKALAWPGQIQSGTFARITDLVVASEKYPYIRSPALLKACRLIPCQNCGRDDGTVVAAHSNQAKHGKGRSIKASDVFVASLCSVCHAALDQGLQMTRAERERMWNACHRQTVIMLVRGSLWPAGLPIPIYTPNKPLGLTGIAHPAITLGANA